MVNNQPRHLQTVFNDLYRVAENDAKSIWPLFQIIATSFGQMCTRLRPCSWRWCKTIERLCLENSLANRILRIRPGGKS